MYEMTRGDETSENLLFHDDNLRALEHLQSEYRGKVKCCFIDPPYNTKNEFEHYSDKFDSSRWLDMMRSRLVLIRELLSEDGSIYVSVDSNEVHYLKVLMDEIFGRDNFQREIIWRIGWVSGFKTTAKNYIRNHDSILYYSKNKKTAFFKKNYIHRDDFVKRIPDGVGKLVVSRLLEHGLSECDAKSIIDLANTEGLPERYPIEDTWNSSSYDRLNSISIVSFSGESVSKTPSRVRNLRRSFREYFLVQPSPGIWF